MDDERPIALLVRPRGKPIPNLPDKTYALPSDSCDALYHRIAAKSRFPIHRLRITKGSDGSLVPNSTETFVDDVGLYEQSTIAVKDLGPQIAWRTVFLLEYLGPLLIHPLLYIFRSLLFHNPAPGAPFPRPTASQTASLLLLVLHFGKRELETLLVHRFSAATMPAFNLVKNSAHYWLLAGANIALFTYSPAAACPAAHDPPYAWWLPAAVLLCLVGEAGNLSAHLTLRGLRQEGGQGRQVPYGGVFAMVPVTCPNYFFETVAWLGIWMATRSLSTGLFVVVAVAQMAVWGRKKEQRYRREFPDKYKKKRFVMLPGIV